MSKRHHAREFVVQMLFQHDLNPDVGMEAVRAMLQEELKNEDIARFAWRLITGVIERRDELDEKISAVAQNWALNRMAATDRNVLRLGAYELLFTETPHRVVIDESLELAKSFGAGQSSSFVNGILDRLIPESKRSGGNKPSSPTPPEGQQP